MGRSLRRWLSWGSRALGATLALAAVGATAAAAQGPPSIALTGGHVDWGLKQSFRAYIAGPIAHGTTTASDGASVNSDGTFRFSFASGTYDLAQHAVVSQFDGTVRFTGHDSGTGPALDLTISDPRLVTSGQTGTLYLDARSRSMSTGQYTDFDDVAFATLDLAGSTRTPGSQQIAIAPIASTLTSEGAAAFAGFYTAGTALDPVALTVSYGRPAPPAPPAPAPVETTPDPQPQPAVSVAAARMTALDRAWNRKRKAAVARIVCRTGTCEIDAPRRVRLEVDGKRYRPAVIAPEQLEQGERGTIRIQASRRALAALAGRAATSRLSFSVRSGGHRDWETLELTLRRSGVTVD
jgi:Htaa